MHKDKTNFNTTNLKWNCYCSALDIVRLVSKPGTTGT